MLIRKYKNRKMYCSELNRCLKLNDISKLVKKDITLQVLDYNDVDVTNEILKMILVNCNIPIQQLIELINQYYEVKDDKNEGTSDN
ncbi:MAG TPA: polyhydroxyalkanoate synthesis regulator DNA-binding domain-containing protein [Patescibacteria group bacterium]|nr:polyhydroxyalkanoate synthesis regulator DNA-binding domain-containing protein [Patescibacteria group bacterium]